MFRRTVIILEDNDERIRDFESAVASFGAEFRLRVWQDAPTMIAECPPILAECCLISLDHDLNPMPDAASDPGTGLEVSEFLAHLIPICPIIIHTSNTERRWSMHNEFRFGKWSVEIIPPIGKNWIQQSWLPKARTLIGLK